MPRAKSKKFETFGDGIMEICEAEERSLTRTKIDNIRFGNRTVGVSRFWSAKTAGNKVDKLVSIPLSVLNAEPIEVLDIAVIKSGDFPGQYKILQLQSKYDTSPPALYVTLEKMVHPFKDARGENG